MSLKSVIRAINQNKRFLVTTHTSPEGDALGSQLAIAQLLKRKNKEAVLINEDTLPLEYSFLPGVESIGRKTRGIKFDAVIMVDCSDKERCGSVANIITKDKPLINIDHHISNTKFGDINWVEPRAAATTEMIYELYKKSRLILNKDVATLLYAGLLTDTGSFRYTNTTPLTHRIAADLLSYGINANEIYRNVYQCYSFSDMKLLSTIFSGMKHDASDRIVWFEIKRGLLSGEKLTIDLTDSVLSFGRSIKGVEVVALFKENLGLKNEVRVNLRSQGSCDVNKIAAYFDGGGHKAASGCTLKGSLEQARNMVLKKIKGCL